MAQRKPWRGSATQVTRHTTATASVEPMDIEKDRARARAEHRLALEAAFESAGLPRSEAWDEIWGPAREPASDGARFRSGNRLRRLAGRNVASRGLDDGRAPGGAEGAALPLAGEISENQIAAIFSVFRSAGIKPHPWAEDEGEEIDWVQEFAIASAIHNALQRLSNRGATYIPEENVDPDELFGTLNAICFVDLDDVATSDDGDDGDRNASQYGHAWDLLVDMALMGSGAVRHHHSPDLTWYHLDHSGSADGDLYPPPAEMMEAISENGWARMARFTLCAILCYLAEVKMMGILFSYGAEAVPGAHMKESVMEALGISTGPRVSGFAKTWDEVEASMRAGRPEHQDTLVYVSKQGWDPFYWDFVLTGYFTWEEWRTGQLSAELARSASKVLYERYCVNVWDTSDNYRAECARRKSLGAAAFGTAIGTFLKTLNEAFQTYDGSVNLSDILNTLEVGNEWDATWYNYTASTPSSDDDEHPAPLDIPENQARWGELARLMVMVCAPIAHICKDIPFTFRFPDLVGWAGADRQQDWLKRVKWVQQVMATGVVDECSRLTRFQMVEYMVRQGALNESTYDDSSSSDEFWAWHESCQEAGYTWPQMTEEDGTVAFVPAALVHEAGFHWWHATSSDERYRDAQQIQQDVEDWLRLVVDSPEITPRYTNLAWSVSGVQFQAWAPDTAPVAATDSGKLQGSYYYDSNPLLQAGMLVRRLLFCRVLGSSRVLWHTYMSTIKDKNKGWGYNANNDQAKGQYNANGLRNDLYDSVMAVTAASPTSSKRSERQLWAHSADGFRHERHAWRRPAWFAYRRLIWLMSEITSQEIVLSAAGATVIRLGCRGGFPYPRAAGKSDHVTAWIAWLDQTADATHFRFTLTTSRLNPGDYRVLSLVPDQPTLAESIQESSDEGYPEGDDELDWLGDGLGHTTSTVAVNGREITVTVRRTDPDNPAPICILTRQASFQAAIATVWPTEEHHRDEIEDDTGVNNDGTPNEGGTNPGGPARPERNAGGWGTSGRDHNDIRENERDAKGR